ncbi:MAG: DNA-processing protein DprA, partial [Candidatus Sumerlaeia bacterium]|nr:DNA-processing protein DprA [Candidatus Sumerlaeia bacterium]
MNAAPAERVRAWLHILLCGAGSRFALAAARSAHAPEHWLSASDAELGRSLRATAAETAALRDPAAAAKAREAHAAFDRFGMALLSVADPEYPSALAATRHPPAVLFVRGDLSPDDRLAVGLVGSRAASNGGMSMARSLSAELAPCLTIISGMALGIDSAAHAAALEAGGRTIAVAGCGLDVDYPAGNRELRRHLVRSGQGAMVSPFPPGTPPRREQFPWRNRVLAGLSLAVVVVEAAERSGALSTAAAALEEGRDVFAVPGDPSHPGAKGCNELLRAGAGVCTSGADVLRELEDRLRSELALRRRAAPGPVPEAPRAAEPRAPKPAP